jgi:hypothetical protein
MFDFTVDIASASGTEDPGSNPAKGHKIFRENIAVVLFIIDLQNMNWSQFI